VDAEQDDFAEFARATWPRLRHAAWLLTGHAQDAEDLASLALARTFARWRRLRRDDPYAYARRCLVNAQIDRVRRSRGRELLTDAPPDRTTTHDLDASDRRRELATLLAVLSERERRIVVLRYYLDVSEAQVATELGVSVGTVKSTSSRALAKLRAVSPGPALAPALTEGTLR
jgi:RNA polymerase sigma-70 factor (sigma-E family)